MKKIGLLLLSLLFFSNSYSQTPCPNLATVVYSGKTYNTVAIGEQCWLKENLDVGTQINGSLEQTNNSLIEKYCYGDLAANCTTYGGFYQWAEAVAYTNGATNTSSPSPAFTGNIQGICPTGWHIPTRAEFTTLATTVSNNSNALKAVGQGTGTGAGTNISGFSALLAGYRSYIGGGTFSSKGSNTFFLSSTVDGVFNAYTMYLVNSDNTISVSSHTKTIGFSIRCLNDLSVTTLLPVELNLFTAFADGRTIQLKWSTQTEKNSDKFVIEKMNSSLGSIWVNVGSIKAAVLSNSTKQYSFADKNLQSGEYQYRLKMIDNDGSFEYSKIVETEVAIPKDFAVSQNYPNPFNPSTKIDYQVPVDAKVILEVYNIAGQKVIELVNQEQSAGYYTVDFGASKLSSGVYVYRLAASDKATGNNFSSIKKMMLLK
jgi:uncharacterized protein (TIGR02145 family)